MAPIFISEAFAFSLLPAKLPLAIGVVFKVNSNVTGSLPDLSEWANDVVFTIRLLL